MALLLTEQISVVTNDDIMDLLIEEAFENGDFRKAALVRLIVVSDGRRLGLLNARGEAVVDLTEAFLSGEIPAPDIPNLDGPMNRQFSAVCTEATAKFVAGMAALHGAYAEAAYVRSLIVKDFQRTDPLFIDGKMVRPGRSQPLLDSRGRRVFGEVSRSEPLTAAAE